MVVLDRGHRCLLEERIKCYLVLGRVMPLSDIHNTNQLDEDGELLYFAYRTRQYRLSEQMSCPK
jgi:hypothetical protein